MNSLKPSLIIIAGPNGSGKTTLTKLLLNHDWAMNHQYINPDDIAKDEFGSWNDDRASLLAAQRADEYRQLYLNNKSDFMFETVFSDPNKIEFVKLAKNNGFFIRFFFICTENPEINIERVSLRVEKNTGHQVPIDKIKSRYYKSLENVKSVLEFCDRTYFYDNSESDETPKIIAKFEFRQNIKNYSNTQPVWFQKLSI